MKATCLFLTALPRAPLTVRPGRIEIELVKKPAFNEDTNTVTGAPQGNTPHADYSA